MSDRVLKIGILCEGPVIERWQALCLEHLQQIEDLEIIFLFCSTETKGRPSFIKRAFNFFSKPNKLWRLYYRFYVLNRVTYFRKVDISAHKSPRVELQFIKSSKNIFSFDEENLEKIRSLKIDIILKFGLGILRGEVLNLPTYGIWSFHHGDEEKYRGLPPGFWETYNNDTKCGLVLQKITDKLDSGYIIEKGFVPSLGRSYVRTLTQLYSIGHRWPAKVCREILTYGQLKVRSESQTKAKIYKAPSNFQFGLFLAKLFYRNFIYLFYKSLFAEKWRIGLLQASLRDLISRPLSNFNPQWLEQLDPRQFEADPFGYQVAQESRVLFESYDYTTNLGHIASVKYSPETQSFSDRREEIKAPYHLSYPFTFQYQNESYCLVEAYTESQMHFYKLDQNKGWQLFKKHPQHFRMHDMTLIEHEGLWYLFYTYGQYGSNARLHILYSSSPFGPFREHLQNPVKVDIRSSRGAGPFFKLDGQIYRPSQNSELEYGHKLTINRILHLSPQEFNEEVVAELSPPLEWGSFDGIHTLSRLDDNLILIDCKTNEWLWSYALRVMLLRFKRVLRF